jgi:hypothetical protein
MVQPPSASRRSDVRLATRVSQSPPAGLAAGAVAILVMVLALTGVIPRALFFVAAVALVTVAYQLDKRFKANAASTVMSSPSPATSAMPPPVGAPPVAPTATGAPPATSTPATSTPASAPLVPPLPVADLQDEHARLTRELTDRVDDDEDVRFEKFMRLRAIEAQLSQQGPPPG